MPANFSVVAENEMTYVVGGGLLEAVGSVTAPVWTTANVKTFNTNLVTIIGNSFTESLIDSTLGVMFSGFWGADDGFKMFGDKGVLSNFVKMGLNNKNEYVEKNAFNKFMTVVGLGAAAYNLGMGEAKSVVKEVKFLHA